MCFIKEFLCILFICNLNWCVLTNVIPDEFVEKHLNDVNVVSWNKKTQFVMILKKRYANLILLLNFGYLCIL